jgi:hypothetical protein
LGERQAGLAEPDEEGTITIEQDEAERDRSFASLAAAPKGECGTESVAKCSH